MAFGRLIHVILLSAIASGQAYAASGKPSPFDIALDNQDYNGATRELDDLAARHPGDQSTKKLLDQYYGRFYAAGGRGDIAEPYLLRAIAASTNSTERDKLAFELARAREVSGYIAKAETDYRKLSTEAAEPAVQRKATLSLARLQVGADPKAAVELLTPMISEATPVVSRWEAHLLLSRAYAILNNDAEARSALQAAWQEAPLTPEPADAIMITASDQAVDKAAAGDRPSAIGLISVGNSGSRFAGIAQLPVCGDTLRPEDSVTVAITADEKRRPIYSAVRASRPGIAQLFTVPLALARQRLANASAIYLTLRCRSGLDANVSFVGGSIRDLSTWLGEKGIYPPFEAPDESIGDPVKQLKIDLKEIETRTGQNDLSLAPILLRLAFLQGVRGRFSEPTQLIDAKASADRALGILSRAGAPEEILVQIRLQTTIILAQNGNIADVAGPATMGAMNAILARPDTTPAQALSAYSSLSRFQLRPAQRLGLADALIGFLDSRKVGQVDPIRQAAELQRAAIVRDLGTIDGLADRLAAHGLPADMCGFTDKPPVIPPSAITLTSDDYPKDLLRHNVSGLTSVELSIAVTGKVEAVRVIASQPMGLFNMAAVGRLAKVTLLPAQRDDQAVACHGMVQTIRWEMPSPTDFTNPFMGYPTPNE